MTKTTKTRRPQLSLHAGRAEDLLPVHFPAAGRKGKQAAAPAARPLDLLVVDPPYDYGEPYDKYEDNVGFAAYMDWSERWLRAAYAALHPHGSLWLFYPDELVSFVDVFCQRELGLHKRCHVVWYYTFGVCNSAGKNFSRSHGHLLYYSKAKTRYTFNDAAVRVPSARAMIYGDKRADPKGKMPDNTWMLLKHQMEEVFAADQDTWLQSRVCGTYKERRKQAPNQIPLPIMERIVLTCSNPGDLVGDCCLGTGTTGVAAVSHGRDFWGCDLSANYLAHAKERILGVLA